MDNKRRQHFRSLLLGEKRHRLESVNDERLGLNASLMEVTGELSSYDNHPGELGTETFEAEKNFSFRTSDRYFINEIEDALHKIENGTFGICEACKNEIAEERLEIVPYTRFCIQCENDYELKPEDEEHGRPIEEQVLFPPFGRSFKDDSEEEQVEYDGEDAWQDVNVYNNVTTDNDYDKEDSFGYVEDVEQISNQQYKKSIE